jgi:hypothetical protein
MTRFGATLASSATPYKQLNSQSQALENGARFLNRLQGSRQGSWRMVGNPYLSGLWKGCPFHPESEPSHSRW